MNKRLIATLMLILVSLVWGAAGPVVKHTLTWFDPWVFLTYRFFISTLIAVPYLYITKTPFPSKTKNTLLLFITSIISAPLSLFLFFEALNKTSALSGSLITATGPLLLILGGVLFFHDNIRKNEKIGIAITILGTILTIVGPFDSFGILEGNILMVCAVISDGIAALLSKEAMKKGVSATLIAQFQFIIGFLVFVPLLLLRQAPDAIMETLINAPLQAHLGVLFMAIFSGTIAYSLRNIAIKTIEISESALYFYLQPVWGAILAVLWLHEAVTPSYIVGGIIITLGVVIAEYHKK